MQGVGRGTRHAHGGYPRNHAVKLSELLGDECPRLLRDSGKNWHVTDLLGVEIPLGLKVDLSDVV
eukprot:5636724-Amphidinium_carterae.1